MPMQCLYAGGMSQILSLPRQLVRPGGRGGHSAALSPLLAIAVAALLLAPALARADTSSTLTVVGTSDVSDSGLIPNLIGPQFQKAYPQFTFKYVGSATGVAIQSAESGTGGPSALIVHAASLENQFVGGGYSYNNQYGNAIFTNDFVLAGPAGDPAGIGTAGAHNVARAFADIATAGSQGKATFFTRGGTTTASGTTVEEHQIWAACAQRGAAACEPGAVRCERRRRRWDVAGQLQLAQRQAVPELRDRQQPRRAILVLRQRRRYASRERDRRQQLARRAPVAPARAMSSATAARSTT